MNMNINKQDSKNTFTKNTQSSFQAKHNFNTACKDMFFGTEASITDDTGTTEADINTVMIRISARGAYFILGGREGALIRGGALIREGTLI